MLLVKVFLVLGTLLQDFHYVQLINRESLIQSVVKFVTYRNYPSKVNLLLECWQKSKYHFKKQVKIILKIN